MGEMLIHDKKGNKKRTTVKADLLHSEGQRSKS